MRGAGDGRCVRAVTLYSTLEMFTTRNSPEVIDTKAKYWSQIVIFVPFGVPVGILP